MNLTGRRNPHVRAMGLAAGSDGLPGQCRVDLLIMAMPNVSAP